MARTFGMNELEANTNRIVGTQLYIYHYTHTLSYRHCEPVSANGYMSPEYVMNGIVSMKSDVYSFGVLVLEIISGKKNNGCYDTERPLNLVGHATDRPTMSDVASMLTNDTMALPTPKQPAFFITISSDYEEPEVTEIMLEVCSVNDVTSSRMEARYLITPAT
ncbi:hypothetical protein CUMW_132310 [Citrus unshiu]|uniref:Protein kinase domain-containing protein n=1 Tax=Citrus unshiu TaxID=55188 RepID=A0A2H5PFQ5_CITUN|nr:hypothetical protein CUMW_132310 [Citrus unshiu]